MSNKETGKLKKICEIIAGFMAVFVFFFAVVKCSDSEPLDEEAAAAKAAKEAAAAAKAAEDKRKGFHCLSVWNGAHRGVVRRVKEQLKDPKSFQHISTHVTPINSAGEHSLSMRYRARNSFGGYVVGQASAIYSNENCVAVVISYE